MILNHAFIATKCVKLSLGEIEARLTLTHFRCFNSMIREHLKYVLSLRNFISSSLRLLSFIPNNMSLAGVEGLLFEPFHTRCFNLQYMK